MFWIGFIVGLILGAFVGLSIAGACMASQRADAYTEAEGAFREWQQRVMEIQDE